MEDARAAIKKVDTFVAARDAMDQAIAAGTTRDAYATRERLILQYKEFEENTDIEERMEKSRKLDRERVQWFGGVKAAETQPREGRVIATTSFAERREQGTAAAGNGDVRFCIAAGRVTAHDVANGKQVWSTVVGADARWLPVPVPGTTGNDEIVLVTDTRHDELIAVRARSGRLVWRQPIGEPIEAAPLVHRNKIYQPTGKGNIVVINPTTGSIDGRLQFGEQRLYTTPVTDESGQHLYVLG